MREVAIVISGIAVGLVWVAIWSGLLRLFDVALVSRKVEGSLRRRELLRSLGKLKYILIFGVFGPGLGFGLTMMTIDLASHRSTGWVPELTKLIFVTACFGLWQGFSAWHKAFRDPVPFPPDYPPAK